MKFMQFVCITTHKTLALDQHADMKARYFDYGPVVLPHTCVYQYTQTQNRLPLLLFLTATLRELSFFTGRGGRLSVMAGHQFFLVPPFAYGKGGDQKKLVTGHHRQTPPPPGKK